jgi:hypothetical protein
MFFDGISDHTRRQNTVTDLIYDPSSISISCGFPSCGEIHLCFLDAISDHRMGGQSTDLVYNSSTIPA